MSYYILINIYININNNIFYKIILIITIFKTIKLIINKIYGFPGNFTGYRRKIVYIRS